MTLKNAISLGIVLLVAALAQAQTPEETYVRFNHDDNGNVRDYADVAGVPSLVGSAQIVAQGGLANHGKQLYINGTNGYCATNRQLAVFGQVWTLEFWFYDERPLSDTTLSYVLATENQNGFRMFRGGSAAPGSMQIRSPGGLDINIPGAAPSQTWTHISIICDQTAAPVPTIDVVVNGSHAGFTQVNAGFGLTSGPKGFTVGSRNGFDAFKGYVDELRLWHGLQYPPQMSSQLCVADEFPYLEDFDGHVAPGLITSTDVPCGWTQVDEIGATDPSWTMRLGATPSLNTGPDRDHSGGGYYAYVEDSNLDAPSVILETPYIDLAPVANPYLRFWCHSNNASTATFENSMHIEVNPRGAPQFILNPTVQDEGNEWKLLTYDLSAAAGALIKIRFIVDCDNGHFLHDIAIDDVAIVDGIGTGIAPDRDRASLDINGARTEATTCFGTGLPVGYEAEGPYFTDLNTGGANMLIDIEGQPNQPIVMVYGPLFQGPSFPWGGLSVGSGNGADGVALFADGAANIFPDLLFRTNANGRFQISIPTHGVPPLVMAFQAILYTGDASIIAFSNAVEVNFY